MVFQKVECRKANALYKNAKLRYFDSIKTKFGGALSLKSFANAF